MQLKIFKRGISYHKLVSWYSGLIKKNSPAPPYIHVTQIGDPILRHVAEPVATEILKTPEIQNIIACLKYTLKKYKSVGLSAPQIGSAYRICVVQFSKEHLNAYTQQEQKQKEMYELPLMVLVNPELKITNFNTVTFPEACESIKGFWSNVPRFRAVEVKAFDENGEQINFKVNGWNARIIQHEVDHLNGKLYTDIMDRKSLTCSCWQVVNERRGKITLPYFPD
ncbi:peptide deformylase, mitochondrial-like [Agrilus planipennis]|uniref:Peptide deformylase n=1 Tax=Agrilus planipennis TaxID=224129 RepID=A0A1W4WYC2_AGRPL|nr:peptide deformylase, mitochondrial-like [Agrilus planipennis]